MTAALAAILVPPTPPQDFTNKVVFTTPGVTDWVVPDGVTRIPAAGWGAGGTAGGQAVGGGFGKGGGGGFVSGTIEVTPGETLKIRVGAPGTPAPNLGGGYTAIFRGTETPENMILLAGGGGAAGGRNATQTGIFGGNGGAGGGPTGANGTDGQGPQPGGGGTGGEPTIGGTGGSGASNNGTALAGGAPVDPSGEAAGSGGGGGGWHGGGSGGRSQSTGTANGGGAGGGGSNFAADGVDDVVSEQGSGALPAQNGHADKPANTGEGGNSSASAPGQRGAAVLRY